LLTPPQADGVFKNIIKMNDNKTRNNGLSDLVILLFIIAASIFLFFQTNTIPAPRFEPLGSAFFPRLILGAIIILSLMLIVKDYFFRRISEPEHDESISTSHLVRDEQAGKVKYVWGTIFLFGIYILLISITDISYLLLTFCFLYLFVWYLSLWRVRFILHALGSALMVTLIIYLIFGHFLNIFFP